jgi:hypothetical protein
MKTQRRRLRPDPASLPAAEGWRAGIAKGLEREFAAFVAPAVA